MKFTRSLRGKRMRLLTNLLWLAIGLCLGGMLVLGFA